MTRIEFKIQLVADGEPGTGMGRESVNDLVPRDVDGHPMIPSTHLKGLIRHLLETPELQHVLGDLDHQLIDGLLGVGGTSDSHGMGVVGHLKLGHARAISVGKNHPLTRQLTRTSINELGVASATTLRTTEAIAAGTELVGSASLPSDAPVVYDLATRFALLSLTSVGGGRSRGSGACLVTITGESRTPGQILRELVKHRIPAVVDNLAIPSTRATLQGKTSLLRLEFMAEDSVFCPEHPIVGLNSLRSGIAIPSSAVLGALITMINRIDPCLATSTLECPKTRAWPMLPTRAIDDVGDVRLATPVHVSLSHKMSKYAEETKSQSSLHVFKDGAIEPYNVDDVKGNNPLKGSDGVLMVAGSRVKLLKSGNIARTYSAHAVINSDRRDLYTVEAIAPTTFVGWINLPTESADVLTKHFHGKAATFGKSRTVRGGGILNIVPSGVDAISMLGLQERARGRHVFVVQSPIAIPNTSNYSNDLSAEEVLRRLVADAGWGDCITPQSGKIDVGTMATLGVRFGWNRHRLGSGVNSTGRLMAQRVVLPGSVFVLKNLPPGDISELLIRGIGDHREQGFGSVLPHPGMANSLHREKPGRIQLNKSDGAARIALELSDLCKGGGPSPAQIAGLMQHFKPIEGGFNVDQAKDYFRRQMERPNRVWERWTLVAEVMRRQFESSSMPSKARVFHRALSIWRDLAVASSKEGD